MDFLKENASKFTGGSNENTNEQSSSSGEQKESGGFLGGITNKINSAAGGGKESEKNEDYLDKGALDLHLTNRPSIANRAFDRRRHGPREVHGPGTSGQRECRRAGQGRADFGFH